MNVRRMKKVTCLLIGIVARVNKLIIEAVKEFLKSMWRIRKHASTDISNGNFRTLLGSHLWDIIMRSKFVEGRNEVYERWRQ